MASKAAAHMAVYRAVQTGKLIRPDVCSRCGSDEHRIEAHHPDYSKQLVVEWLCAKCHRADHWAVWKGNAPEQLMSEPKTFKQKEREGIRLRAAIEKAGYTQSAIARRIGVGETHFSRWCRGVEPMPHYKDAISKELRVPIEEIWDE